MDAINLLRKAHKADKLGNYKLADNLYNKAFRYAAGERAIEEALIKALEEAGIRKGEALSVEAIKAAIEKAIAAGDKSSLEALMREAGVAEKDIPSVVEDALKGATEDKILNAAARIAESLNGPEGIARRMNLNLKPKTNIFNKSKEIAGNIKQRIQSMMEKLGPRGKKSLAVAGISATVVGGVYVFSKINGEPASDEEVENALNGNDPYENMYQKRMDAGQQQRQNDAAQKFFDENKDKFKSQREFYNAAKAKGDENFANSAIAILKKNMPELPREPQSK